MGRTGEKIAMTNPTNYLAGASLNDAQELAETAEQILNEYNAFLRARGLTRLEPEKPGPASEILQAEILEELEALQGLPINQPIQQKEDIISQTFQTLRTHEKNIQAKREAQARADSLEAARVKWDQLSEIEEQQIKVKGVQNGIELSNIIERG